MAIQHITTKRLLYTFVVLFLAAAIQLSGCKKTENKTDEGVAVDTAKTQINNTYITEYTTYRTQTEQELAANRDSIAAYKIRIKNSKAKIKADLEKARLELEKQNSDLQAQLAAYKDEGKDKWEKFKTDFNRSKDSVNSKWNNLIQKIKHDDD